MSCILYFITHRATGREYIGITSKSLALRISRHRASVTAGSRFHIHCAVREYGWDAFDVRTEAEFSTFEEAKSAEKASIADRRPEFNHTNGGDGMLGFNFSDESRARMSKSHIGIPNNWTGRRHSAETRAKISMAANSISDETRERMSVAKRGKSQAPEHVEKRVCRLRGRTRTEETRRRISAAVAGKRRTPEQCARIAAAAQAREARKRALQCR